MNEQPLVTIAIPAFNPDFFREALHSALIQDYPQLEILVCDDSHDDRIRLIVDELVAETERPVSYLRNTHRLGFSCNLQVCVERSTGSLIKLLCDDDYLTAQCISLQVDAMNGRPSIGFCTYQRFLCDADGNLLPSRMANAAVSQDNVELKGSDLLEVIEPGVYNLVGGISHCLFRRDLVLEFLPLLVQGGKGFQARLDLALYVCLLRRSNLASLKRVLGVERLHAGQWSHQSVTVIAYEKETEWLREMLQARPDEPAPATGWARYRALGGEAGEWREYDLNHLNGRQLARTRHRLGTDCITFEDVYQQWLDYRQLSSAQLDQLSRRVSRWPRRPRIVPVVWVQQGEERALQITLDSLKAQAYGSGPVLILAPWGISLSQKVDAEVLPVHGQGLEQLNQRLDAAREGEWVFLLRAGDRLQPHALAVMAERMALRAECVCLYMDEGRHDGLRSSAPVFKPDFNLDLMRSIPFVGRALAFDCAALRQSGGFDVSFDVLAPHDALWRMVETRGVQVIEHVDELLLECEYHLEQWLTDSRCVSQAPRVVAAHLQRLGIEAEIIGREDRAQCRVRYCSDLTAGVSILLSAGDDLVSLVRCVEALFESTAHARFELLLLADVSTPVPVRQWMQAMSEVGGEQLRVIEVDACADRYNQGAQHARMSYVMLFDIACLVFDQQWLAELLSQAQRPEVGIVGPKLSAANGKIVAAGKVLGLDGVVGTPFKGSPGYTSGYQNRLEVVQNWSVLPSAGMLIRRELFSALEGLDADMVLAGLDSADLCLKVREQGYLVVWTPYSQLGYLGESEPVRGGTQAIKHARLEFYQRWLSVAARDPAYNRNLALASPAFRLEPGSKGGWDPFISRIVPAVLAMPANATAVGTYRVIQPLSALEEAGWIQGQLHHGAIDPMELERINPDIIIFQCRYSQAALDEMVWTRSLSQARHIYEIDDYVLEVPDKNDHGRGMPGNMRELVRDCIAQCDRVIVSTAPLAEALSNLHHDIRVVPNMLAPERWVGLSSRRQTSAKPRVGWAGGTSHRGDLEMLEQVVKLLADRVDWVFMGMCPPSLRPYVKEFHRSVPLAQYPRKLAALNLDLALAPLEQHLFNDCKSNLRLLEYGACGFPVICSDSKAYAGYLPCTRVRENTTEQWLEAILMHLADPQASYRQGDALREAVMRDYVLMPHNLQQWANAWLAN
ncbi:glycosyltransferase [Pseudomonas sp. NPDC089401]|uniref:glycosyltransferase n=1 Tax=Pseudomonas sp. NPDC089401 TaxID=3364462 RepID=UPI0037FA3BD7